jgi:DNA-binding transcriptional regulator YiaG
MDEEVGTQESSRRSAWQVRWLSPQRGQAARKSGERAEGWVSQKPAKDARLSAQRASSTSWSPRAINAAIAMVRDASANSPSDWVRPASVTVTLEAVRTFGLETDRLLLLDHVRGRRLRRWSGRRGEPKHLPVFIQKRIKIPPRDPVAAAIVRARASAKLTQGELAERLNTHQGNIARLERGRTQATVRTLKRIATATGHRLVIEFRK